MSKVIEKIKEIPDFQNYSAIELSKMTGIKADSIRHALIYSGLKIKTMWVRRDYSRFENNVRKVLMNKPMNLGQLSRATKIKRTFLDAVTAHMYDVAEDDKGNLFLVGY